MEIQKNFFGVTINNQSVYEYTLINDNLSFIKILNYGGTITEICVPDKKGFLENVVLGLNNLKDYEEKSPYFGSLIGRVAGRISNSNFCIDNVKYNLEANNNTANLHGGPMGFDKQIWNVEEIKSKDYAELHLTYFSPDGDQGFPGNLNIKAKYKFNNYNQLEISYEAESDKKTIVALTNHSYFNLSGNYKKNILNHYLKIDADNYCLIDSEVIPKGISNVKNTPFDFTKSKKIGQDLFLHSEQLKNGKGYDHPFILNKYINPEIILEEKTSGRILEISTDQPTVVMYTGNCIGKEMLLKEGIQSDDYFGVCFETQWYPDAINKPFFPSYMLSPNEKYTSKTTYTFKVES